MPFLPLIPAATDQLSVSQGNILNNFGILGAIAGNNNASSASISNTSGFNWIYLPTQAASIPPAGSAFPAGEIGLYSASNPNTVKNELYVNKTNQATVTQVPMTASILSTVSAPASFAAGWTYLPSGIMLMWGIENTGGVAAGSYVIPLTPAFPDFAAIFNVQLTPVANGAVDPDSSFNLQAVLTAGQNFTVRQSSRSVSGGAVTNTQFFYLITGIPVAY